MDGGGDKVEKIISVPEVGEPQQSGVKSAKAAKAELAELSQGKSDEELKREAAQREHGRAESFKDAFEGVAITALRILAVGLFVLGFIWIINLIVPDNMRWLSAAEMDKLQDILTGGLLAGFLVEHFKRRMN